ncbi:hypothetical protein [Falsiroseomonas sp. HW251]|uniref:hypothetical protein n=1 Tax=Falsiroseomonas sp. HW251 TaxID=3390998 RepID=UPI003D3117E4
MPVALHADTLRLEFPDLHPDAVLHVTFQRTLRVPDDATRYGLPPGLGRFPLRAVDELRQDAVPQDWKRRGGIALPMWQAEACWLSFSSPSGYPFALKVAAGKVNAVNGAPWTNELDAGDQDYIEVPGQPWLDGFCVEKGVVRQFVAMPLGQGYTAEEQVTGKAEHGGIQLLARPLKAAIWEEREEARRREEEARRAAMAGAVFRHASPPLAAMPMDMAVSAAASRMDMGLAPGGSIVQEIAKPQERADAWDDTQRARCFVQIANSEAWTALTGAPPPTRMPTAADYRRAGLPWFEWYADRPARAGSSILATLKSVATLGREKREAPLPDNESFDPPEPVRLGPAAARAGRLEGTW